MRFTKDIIHSYLQIYKFNLFTAFLIFYSSQLHFLRRTVQIAGFFTLIIMIRRSYGFVQTEFV